MGKGVTLYPKRKGAQLEKAAGDSINSVINQITSTTIQQLYLSGNEASTITKGIIRIANVPETTAGTDSTIAVSPYGLKEGYQGSSNIVTVGTLSAGDVTTQVSASSLTVAGKIEVATTTETTTGTDATRTVSPDGLAGSGYGKRIIELPLNRTTALTTSDKAYVRIPSTMNGWNLIEVASMCYGASSSGAVTLTVKNGSTNMLSTNITIDQDEFDTLTATAPAVIDTAEDDVATGAQIEVACSGAGTGVTFCVVELTFQLP